MEFTAIIPQFQRIWGVRGHSGQLRVHIYNTGVKMSPYFYFFMML